MNPCKDTRNSLTKWPPLADMNMTAVAVLIRYPTPNLANLLLARLYPPQLELDLHASTLAFSTSPAGANIWIRH